jgi:hypothetical protein
MPPSSCGDSIAMTVNLNGDPASFTRFSDDDDDEPEGDGI